MGLPVQNAQIEGEHQKDEEKETSPDPDYRIDCPPPVNDSARSVAVVQLSIARSSAAFA